MTAPNLPLPSRSKKRAWVLLTLAFNSRSNANAAGVKKIKASKPARIKGMGRIGGALQVKGGLTVAVAFHSMTSP